MGWHDLKLFQQFYHLMESSKLNPSLKYDVYSPSKLLANAKEHQYKFEFDEEMILRESQHLSFLIDAERVAKYKSKRVVSNEFPEKWSIVSKILQEFLAASILDSMKIEGMTIAVTTHILQVMENKIGKSSSTDLPGLFGKFLSQKAMLPAMSDMYPEDLPRMYNVFKNTCEQYVDLIKFSQVLCNAVTQDSEYDGRSLDEMVRETQMEEYFTGKTVRGSEVIPPTNFENDNIDDGKISLSIVTTFIRKRWEGWGKGFFIYASATIAFEKKVDSLKGNSISRPGILPPNQLLFLAMQELNIDLNGLKTLYVKVIGALS